MERQLGPTVARTTDESFDIASSETPIGFQYRRLGLLRERRDGAPVHRQLRIASSWCVLGVTGCGAAPFCCDSNQVSGNRHIGGRHTNFRAAQNGSFILGLRHNSLRQGRRASSGPLSTAPETRAVSSETCQFNTTTLDGMLSRHPLHEFA